MLEELIITNLGIIGEAHLEPSPGLVVVTGETGTGKTMLLGALRLLLGAPARRDLVGPVGDDATVQARFRFDDEEVLVARRISREGRSRAYLDGLMAPAKALEERTAGAVELVAQHDHLRLTRPAEVRNILDGSLDDVGRRTHTDYREAWTELEKVRSRQAELGGDRRALERELEVARHQAEEIAAAAFAVGEDESLDLRAGRLRNAQAIIESLDEAATDLGADVIEPAMDRVVIALSRTAGLDPTAQTLAEQAVDLATLVAELRSGVVAAAGDVAAEPAELDEVEGRIALLGHLRRKYGATLDDVIAYGVAAGEKAAHLHGLLEEAEELESRLASAESAVATVGARLTAARQEAADHLAATAIGHLCDLGFTSPHLAFRFEPVVAGPDGTDRIELMFASDVRLEPGPIGRIASGGELSRLVLALRLAAGAAEVGVAAFDEIDAGIGGEVAMALGRKLAGLAAHRQVLCVTHLPQIAAFAATHYVVVRNENGASISEVTGSDRVAELSRMLAGMPESERGREHAAELLAAAGGGSE